MDSPEQKTTPVKPRKLLRRLLWFGGGGLLGLIILYFVATSSGFLKAFVLPRLNRMLNATLTVQDISLSPFSQVVLNRLALQTTGAEPLLQAAEARVRYSLWSILRGNIVVPEITLTSPVVQIVNNPDGTSNLDPLLKAFATSEPKPAAPAKSVMQLDLKNVALKQALVRWISVAKNGQRQALEISGLNITLDQLQNGKTGKLALSADTKYETSQASSPAGQTPDVMQTRLSGNFEFGLTPDLLPQNVSGALRCDVVQAQGAWQEMAALSSALECEMTPTAIKKLGLRFERKGQALGQLRLYGPYELAKNEGRINLEILSLDRQVLNLFGAAHGWDFAQTQINATNQLDIAQRGRLLDVSGLIAGSHLSLKQKELATPVIDLGLDYKVSVDLNDQAAVVKRLIFTGRQGSADFLQTSLDRPMRISWGKELQGFYDSAIKIAITNLNLSDWSFVLGPSVPLGRVSMQGQLLSQKDGNLLSADLSAQAGDVLVKMGTNTLKAAQVLLQLKGRMENYDKITVDSYRVQCADPNQPLLSLEGSAYYELKTATLRCSTALDAALAAGLQKYPVPFISASAGNVKMTVSYSQQQSSQTVVGSLALDNFTGRMADYSFQNYKANLDYDLEVKEQKLKVNRASLKAAQSFDAGGGCEASGTVSLAQTNAQLSFTLLDLNQYALAPFLAPYLAPRILSSLTLAGNGTLTYDPKGQSSVKTDLKVANLVLKDPAAKSPPPPLNAQFQLDASLDQRRLARLNQLAMTIMEASQPGGRLELNGIMDLSNHVVQASFKLADLNQRALGPWLAPALTPRTLKTVNVNAQGSIAYDPAKDSTITADLAVTNLVVNDPQQPAAATPLAMRFQLDSSVQKSLVQLRQANLSLTPTTLAKNQLQTSGRLLLSPSNTVSGQLAIQSEALDLNPVYQLWTANGATNQNKPKTTPPASSGKPVEPGPLNLPLQDFALDVKVDRLFLGDLTVTNWQTSVKINQGMVNVNPLQLALNGTPVQGNVALNLGVPGYAYDVSLQSGWLPVKPLANTFLPATRDQYTGQAAIQAQIKGAGLTEPNLQKNLSGQVLLGLTNADVSLLSPTIRTILTPIAAVLQLNELVTSPLDAVNLQAQMGQGVINVLPSTVYSAGFQVQCAGPITLAPALTNSTLNLPITLFLKRSLAEKAKLLPANAPADAQYVQLPPFVKVTGTLGNYKTEIDKLAAAQLGLRTVVAIPGVSGTKAGSAISAFGNALSGDKGALGAGLSSLIPGLSANTNAAASAATNLPGSSSPSLGGLLQGLGGFLPTNSTRAPQLLKANESTTNRLVLTNRTPSVVTNAATATNPAVRGLIQGLGNILNRPAATNQNK